MVGVPALALWLAGPSSRMCWPMRLLTSHRRRNSGGHDGDGEGGPTRGHEREHRSAAHVLGSRRRRHGPRAPRPPRPGRRRAGERRPPPGWSRGPCRPPPPRRRRRPDRPLGRWPAAGRARRAGDRRHGAWSAEGTAPARTSADDGFGVLVARVVRGEDGHVGQAGGRFAHQGALGPVPAPPAAEDHEDPPAGPGQSPGLAQGHLEAGRGVGVVDETVQGAPRSGVATTSSRPGTAPAADSPAATTSGSTPRTTAASAASRAFSTLTAPVIASSTRWARQVNEEPPGSRARPSEAASRRTADQGDPGVGQQPSAPAVVGVHHPAHGPLGREQRGLGREVVRPSSGGSRGGRGSGW